MDQRLVARPNGFLNFRQTPYKWTTTVKVPEYNYNRLAEVWMDDYNIAMAQGMNFRRQGREDQDQRMGLEMFALGLQQGGQDQRYAMAWGSKEKEEDQRFIDWHRNDKDQDQTMDQRLFHRSVGWGLSPFTRIAG